MPPAILTTVVTPAFALPPPGGFTNGQTVATLQGVWSNGQRFTGSFEIYSQTSDFYTISGNSVVVNDAAGLNASGTIAPFWVVTV